MPSLSFLILTYRSSSFVDKFFDSLYAKFGDKISKGEYEVIIIDNLSPDNTEEVLKKKISGRKNISFFKNSENKGYASGINAAASHASGEFLVVVNPDAEFLDCNFEKVIEEFQKNEKLGIAGLVLERENQDKERTAGSFYNVISLLIFSLGLEDVFGLRFAPSKVQKVDFVSGGFVVFRKECFEKLKGYDEDYFMYVEDMDICYRAKKSGFETYYLPYATIKHRGQGSSSREFAIVNIFKGFALFYEKHGTFLEQQCVKSLLSLKAALIIFLGSIFNKRELVSTYTKALKALS